MIRLAVSVFGLIGVGTMCGVMNQNPAQDPDQRSHDEQRRIETIQAQLEVERLGLDAQGELLRSSHREIGRLKAEISILRKKINAVAKSYPQGIPPPLYDDWKLARDRYDRLVQDHDQRTRRYSALYVDYVACGDRYSRRLADVCTLAAKVGRSVHIAAAPDWPKRSEGAIESSPPSTVLAALR